MKFKAALLFLLLPLAISSCGSNSSYDVKKPNVGGEVNEATIPLRNGEKATLKKGMSYDELGPIIINLNEIYDLNNNWDETLDLKLIDDNKSTDYSSKGKIRYTNNGDKHGFYRRYESGKYVTIEASTSPSALPYNSFTYSTYKNKYVSFYGRVPDDSLIETINKNGEKILFKDPEYEPGMYFMNDITAVPPAGEHEYTNNYIACNMLSNTIHNAFPCYSMSNLALPTFIDEQVDVTYKLTSNYLVLNIDRPCGYFILNPPLGADMQVLIEASKSVGCFVKTELIYNLDNGKLAYVKSSFKTINFSPEFRSRTFEGNFKLKIQKESDEGYNKFVETRNKIMKEYTTKN